MNYFKIGDKVKVRYDPAMEGIISNISRYYYISPVSDRKEFYYIITIEVLNSKLTKTLWESDLIKI